MYSVMFTYPDSNEAFWVKHKETVSEQDAEFMLLELLENQIRLGGPMMVAQLLCDDMPIAIKGIAGNRIVDGHIMSIHAKNLESNDIEFFIRSGWHATEDNVLHKAIYYLKDFTREIELFSEQGYEVERKNSDWYLRKS